MKIDTLSVCNQKRLCRLALRHVRKKISHERQLEASLNAFQFLLESTDKAFSILSYASFGTELNLWLFNQTLARKGQLVLPKIEPSGLLLFKVHDLRYLKGNKYGILEPVPYLNEAIEPSTLSIALIPGLGFDLKSCHRIGYGKGYYDRLLKNLSTTVNSWGIGYKEQACDFLPISDEDIPLTKHYLF